MQYAKCPPEKQDSLHCHCTMFLGIGRKLRKFWRIDPDRYLSAGPPGPYPPVDRTMSMARNMCGRFFSNKTLHLQQMICSGLLSSKLVHRIESFPNIIIFTPI